MSRSGIALIMRFIFVPVIFFTVGIIALLGWQLIEPFTVAFSAPSGLGWGDPGDTALRFTALAFAGLLLVIAAWGLFAPIRSDRRQQVRRRP